MSKAAQKKVVLTDRGLNALKPAPVGKRYWVWDAMMPHLGVRVTDKGRRSFFVTRRSPGEKYPARHLLGVYPALSLADARKAAPAALTAIADGKSPEAVARDKAREAVEKTKAAFTVLAEDFITRHVCKLKTAKDVTSLIRRELCERWRDRQATDVTRRDVFEMIDEIVDGGHPYLPVQAPIRPARAHGGEVAVLEQGRRSRVVRPASPQ